MLRSINDFIFHISLREKKSLKNTAVIQPAHFSDEETEQK